MESGHKSPSQKVFRIKKLKTLDHHAPHGHITGINDEQRANYKLMEAVCHIETKRPAH
jgi:hypothetical protein